MTQISRLTIVYQQVVITTPLFTVAETWNKPRYLSTDKGQGKHDTDIPWDFFHYREKMRQGWRDGSAVKNTH